jgi:hypothetical protein
VDVESYLRVEPTAKLTVPKDVTTPPSSSLESAEVRFKFAPVASNAPFASSLRRPGIVSVAPAETAVAPATDTVWAPPGVPRSRMPAETVRAPLTLKPAVQFAVMPLLLILRL